MASPVTKLPIKTDDKAREREIAAARGPWSPIENLRREIDRVFESFDRGFPHWPTLRSAFELEPFWRRELFTGAELPAVDIVEHDKDYSIEAEIPGLDASNIDVSVVNGVLTIKGEKKAEKEEKKKSYYLSERHYGSFRRSFRVPEGVDSEHIEATFDKGVLKLTLPKTAEAQKAEKKITIKAA